MYLVPAFLCGSKFRVLGLLFGSGNSPRSSVRLSSLDAALMLFVLWMMTGVGISRRLVLDRRTV